VAKIFRSPHQPRKSLTGTMRAFPVTPSSAILDPEVRCLIATIGGSNSSSLIPYLDFQAIKETRKVICGYSDITSLHGSIMAYSGLRTFYGPAVMCWHGEWPDGDAQSVQWFLDAVMQNAPQERVLTAPSHWSEHRRRWDNGGWKNISREWKANPGWTVQNPGTVEAPLVAFNLNTLLTAAGTSYWPEL
jgi:muramoyltetrapeptide carboxypeptidase LdcA involved in peptidoglycan recycling